MIGNIQQLAATIINFKFQIAKYRFVNIDA